ncbi:MAG: hypothetical protein HYT77_06715 [Deltaproteobacteria bacterium]|nr:hypothetical protein [Deltaproteobacteria bacterium]
MMPLQASSEISPVVRSFFRLTKNAEWKLVKTVPLSFETYHPQGMVKIGDFFYLSSVEVVEKTTQFLKPEGRYDRTTGKGRGYLFQFDQNGKLIGRLTLGEGASYHPGGIDYDGESLWVPVAEYRPHGPSIIYRVDPQKFEASVAFRIDDHIGAVAVDPKEGRIYGANWDSRRLYIWNRNGEELKIKNNVNHLIDYQDCHFQPSRYMLCGGLNRYRPSYGGEIPVGGIDLLDLRSMTPIHQIPVMLFTKNKEIMTRNPWTVEASGNGTLRFYFLPEDGKSTLYLFEAAP